MRSVRRHASAGFTLMELLIVVIIIGILATLALPQLPRAQEAARQAEARSILGQIWQAEKLYFQQEQDAPGGPHYTGTRDELVAAFPPDNSVDHYFKYSVASPDATHFTATATRKVAADTGRAPPWASAYTLTVNETGKYSVSAF